jgi:Do/DeqQ family serine protease
MSPLSVEQHVIKRSLSCAIVSVALALPVSATPQSLPGPDERGIVTIAPVLESVTEAVVNISVVTERPMEANPLFRDPFFRRFFDLPEMVPRRPRMSVGSGVIVDADKGYVVTNHHVIEDGDRVNVTLKDRRQLRAEVIGSDPGTDIAVLQIESDGLTEIPLGDSDALKVGDFVVAIGNPFGLGQTVTSGIISALGRSGINPEGYDVFIQTDASINPGNSGGALVTLDGKLVGINAAIVSPAGGNVGIGIAVPINMARAVMEQVVKYGEVRRASLGVMIQDLTPDLADALDVDVWRGAVVASVEPDSPAEKVGLRAGDIILEVDRVPVYGSGDLRSRIGLMHPGKDVVLTILRDGKRVHVEADLERSKGKQQERHGGVSRALAGADFEELRPGLPGYGEVEGLAVTAVAPGSRAARAGLRPGDVVTAVNNQPVRSIPDLAETLAAGKRITALHVYRDGARLFIVVPG